MSDLLLTGFESDAGYHHHCRIFPVGAAAYEADIGNIFVHRNWLCWFRHQPDVWDQPEGHHIWTSQAPERIHNGTGAWMYFTFNRRHDAGLMRQFTVTPGQWLRLSAYYHAWSNHAADGFPHPDDPKWSEGVGYGAIALRNPGQIPPLNGDGQNDALGNFAFSVGIDPTGGLDPYAATVVWGDAWAIYNAYSIPVEVYAQAAGDTVTLFTRSVTLWPFKHNDAYLDDIRLETTAAPEPPAPEPCRGVPRIQYEAHRILVPGDLMLQEAAWLALTYPHATITESADEAGIGDLDALLVTILNPDRWEDGADELAVFFATYYPQAEVEFVYYPEQEPEPEPPDPEPPPSGDVPWTADIVDELAHNPGPWGDATLNAQGGWWQRTLAQIDGLTIHHTLHDDPYAVAETYVQKEGGRPSIPYTIWIGKDGKVTLTNDLTEGCWHDHTGNRNTHLSVGLAGDCRVAELPAAQMAALVKVAAWAVRNPEMAVTFESVKGHQDYIATACPGWQYGWKETFYHDLRYVLAIPEPEPPADFNPRVLTLHLQQDVEAAQRFVQTCKPAGIKRVMDAQNLPTYAVLNPGMRCVYRNTDEHPDPITFVNNQLATLHQVADMFEERGLPLIDGHYFWWESYNEVYGYDRGPNIEWRDRELAVVNYLAQKEPRVGVVAFNAGVGNIHPPNFDVLVPLAQRIEATGGMFGLHSYFGATPDRCSIDHYEDEGRWLESRWEMTDDYLVAHGVKVNWFLSEGGAIYYEPPTNMPSSAAGFRYPRCMNADWPRYLAYLEKLAQRFYQQNLKRGGRLKGYAIFTEGGAGWGWDNFELRSPELDDIAAMQARIWPVT